jgi:uncharacterized small protein (DUF1192 family)
LPGAILTVNEAKNLYNTSKQINNIERNLPGLRARLNQMRGMVFNRRTPYNNMRFRQEFGHVGGRVEELSNRLNNLRTNRRRLNTRLRAKYNGNGQVLGNGTVLQYNNINFRGEKNQYETWAWKHAENILREKLRKPARRAAAMSLFKTNNVQLNAAMLRRLIPYRSIHGNYRLRK